MSSRIWKIFSLDMSITVQLCLLYLLLNNIMMLDEKKSEDVNIDLRVYFRISTVKPPSYRSTKIWKIYKCYVDIYTVKKINDVYVLEFGRIFILGP